MPEFTEILPERLTDHRAVPACCQLMPEWRDTSSIEVLQLQRKSAVYRLARPNPGRPTLIAKRCLEARALSERAVYEGTASSARRRAPANIRGSATPAPATRR